MDFSSLDVRDSSVDDNTFMVVNAGETVWQAAERHRRATGHEGALIVAAFNGRRRGNRGNGKPRLAA